LKSSSAVRELNEWKEYAENVYIAKMTAKKIKKWDEPCGLFVYVGASAVSLGIGACIIGARIKYLEKTHKHARKRIKKLDKKNNNENQTDNNEEINEQIKIGSKGTFLNETKLRKALNKLNEKIDPKDGWPIRHKNVVVLVTESK